MGLCGRGCPASLNGRGKQGDDPSRVLIPGPVDVLPLCDKRGFVGVIALRSSGWEEVSGVPGWD